MLQGGGGGDEETASNSSLDSLELVNRNKRKRLEEDLEEGKCCPRQNIGTGYLHKCCGSLSFPCQVYMIIRSGIVIM